MSVNETEETLTDPNNRILRQITVTDATTANQLFEDLMRNCYYRKKRIY